MNEKNVLGYALMVVPVFWLGVEYLVHGCLVEACQPVLWKWFIGILIFVCGAVTVYLNGNHN